MCVLHSRGEEVNTLCKAAKHMLEVADANQYAVANQAPHGDVMAYNAAVNNLRTALEQEEEASAWLAERKEHWRKEREKAQATKDQDPELSAALGWPGGISDPVLDRKVLLQMVAALMRDKLWEDHRVRHLWDHVQQAGGWIDDLRTTVKAAGGEKR